MKFRRTISSMLVVAASATAAFAGGTPQDHHCKLTDGTFDGTKTKKECGAAKGDWFKDASYTGTLATGINAPGGETTGVTLQIDAKTTFELDTHGDAAIAKSTTDLNGKKVTVTGYPVDKAGVEIKQRHLIIVSTIAAAK